MMKFGLVAAEALNVASANASRMNFMEQSKKTGGLGFCEREFHTLISNCPFALLHAPYGITNGVIGPGWFWESREKSSNLKPADDLVAMLELCNRRRANYLLNVGPDRTGRLPAPAVEKLREIGKLREIHP